MIYPEELEIKDTTDAPKWANYLDLYLEFDALKCANFPYLSSIFMNPLHVVFFFHS